MLSRMARTEKIASAEPAAPRRWPIEDFVDDMEIFEAASPTRRSTRAKFDGVGHGRCAMGIDVVDIVGREVRPLQRCLHAAIGAGRRLPRGAVDGETASPDMPVADDFGIDLGAARLGVFEVPPARPPRRLRP